MSHRSRRRSLTLLTGIALLLAAAACTAPTTSPEPSPAHSTRPADSATPTPTTTTRPTTYAMPVALVVHATRPTADVSLAEARRAVAGRVAIWAQVGQAGGAVELLRPSVTRTEAEVLAAVRSSDKVLGILPADAVDATVRVLTVAGHHPLRDPARYPLTVSSSTPLPEVTTLNAVGDLVLGGQVGARMARDGDYRAPFTPTADRVKRAEITVATFASTLSADGGPTGGEDWADPMALAGLREAGVDLVSLADDRLDDAGQRALVRTFDRFEGTGIATVGAGRSAAEARLPVIVVRNDLKIGFIAVDAVGRIPAASDDRSGTNGLDRSSRTGMPDGTALARIGSDIADLRTNVDAVVVLVHGSAGDDRRLDAGQRTAARAFAKAGATLVIGTRPDGVQGWERFGPTPVVYSLGAFVTDRDVPTSAREGVVLEVVLWGSTVKAVEPVPYVIGRDFAPRFATGPRADRILDDVWSTSRGPYVKP